jgi:hypothetical protein
MASFVSFSQANQSQAFRSMSTAVTCRYPPRVNEQEEDFRRAHLRGARPVHRRERGS